MNFVNSKMFKSINISIFYLMSLMMGMLLLIKEPMQLLMIIMSFMMMIILQIFMQSLDYWTMFIMILSFLVGLFLMFVYMVSFTKKETSFSATMTSLSKNFFFLIFLLILISQIANQYTLIYFSFGESSSFSWYEKWAQEKSEVMIFFVMAFLFLIMLMFYMMKKTKKNMKSSA